MSIKKNLVIGINNIEEERVVEIRTTDDGSICIDPKAEKIVITECDLDCALNELKKFNKDNKKTEQKSRPSPNFEFTHEAECVTINHEEVGNKN